MDFQKTDNEQASGSVALKEQMAAKELIWDREKQTIIRVLTDDHKSEIVAMKKQVASKELTWDNEKLEIIRVKKSEIVAVKKRMASKELIWDREKQQIINAFKSEGERRQIEKVVTEKKKDEIILSLRQRLLEKQNENAEFNQVVKSLKENEMMAMEAKLKTEEQNLLKQTILELETYAFEKFRELIRSEAEWKIKLTALEDRMRSELAANEESFQREQDLQRQSRQMEEWRNQKEEEIKLLTQQNADLQEHNISLRELTKQTDKEKEQFKNEQNKLKQTILDLESYAFQKVRELIRSEAEWKIKLPALADRMRSELAANEENFQRELDLQRQSRQMEEWHNQNEEEIKLLTQQNADLQEHNISLRELTKQTDKEKEQFKKEQKKLKQTILDLESYDTQKDSELIRSEAEWKIKLTALEDRMRSELAGNEESFQRENADLQVDNLRLQVLAQQTDKEKAQIKKEEKKARKEAENTLKEERKEAENTLKKERKEEEKRDKKEKKENEKSEKEELKRQKERKENENRHWGELKRQKKELMELMENKKKGGSRKERSKILSLLLTQPHF